MCLKSSPAPQMPRCLTDRLKKGGPDSEPQSVPSTDTLLALIAEPGGGRTPLQSGSPRTQLWAQGGPLLATLGTVCPNSDWIGRNQEYLGASRW